MTSDSLRDARVLAALALSPQGATPPPLNTLRDRVHQLARSKGWYDREVTVATHVANLHGEVSELWEAYRAGRLNELCDKAEKMRAAGIVPLTCLEEELADIVIRALDMAGHMGVDIELAVESKHAFNMTRPVRHGGKVA